MSNLIVCLVLFSIAGILNLVVIGTNNMRAIDNKATRLSITQTILLHLLVLTVTAVSLVCQLWNHWWFHAVAMIIFLVTTSVYTWLVWENSCLVRMINLPTMDKKIRLPKRTSIRTALRRAGVTEAELKKQPSVTMNNRLIVYPYLGLPIEKEAIITFDRGFNRPFGDETR